MGFGSDDLAGGGVVLRSAGGSVCTRGTGATVAGVCGFERTGGLDFCATVRFVGFDTLSFLEATSFSISARNASAARLATSAEIRLHASSNPASAAVIAR